MEKVSRREALLAGATLNQVFGSEPVPLVAFGPHRVSRLIVGGNPISGNSHISPEVSRQMRDYFTAARVLELLRRCEQAGINTWQARGDRHILRLLNEHRLEGGRMHFIAQTASELADIPAHIRALAAEGAIGIYHHGSQTDRFWKAGRIEQAREMLKVMRDTGVRVGLGTHIPEVIDYAEEKGWDLDFYMACLYNLSEPRPQAGGEAFVDDDRPKMLERIRRTSKQCLIFKVYGAGRKCGSPEARYEALRLVAAYTKPSDCVVIGMYPKASEQVLENCRLFREAFAAAS